MSVSRTLAGLVSLSGTGLFTGISGTLTLEPAAPGDGIGLLLNGGRVRATIENLATRTLIPAFSQFPARHTCIGAGDSMLATVEHLLSALSGLGITDATLSCTGPETPIFDGSSAPFVEAIRAVGTVDRPNPEGASIALAEPIRVQNGDASIVITPRQARGISYTYNLAYPAPIGEQSARWNGEPDAYASEIAPARTFSLEQEARLMQSLGLFKHLTPREMLVIGPSGPIDNALRFPDEPARHKLLDLIGDLSLTGPALSGLNADIVATRSGHALAHDAARSLASALA